MPPKAGDRLNGKYYVIKNKGVRFWFRNSNDEITVRFVPTSEDAEYFVLRLDTDPAARIAALAYADAVEATAPEVAADLRAKVYAADLRAKLMDADERPSEAVTS